MSQFETKMLLKEYWETWPPTVTIGDADFTDKVTVPPMANLGDIVLKVKNRAPGELELRLWRARQAEYTVLLQVPSSAQKKIFTNIVQKKNMTLRKLENCAFHNPNKCVFLPAHARAPHVQQKVLSRDAAMMT